MRQIWFWIRAHPYMLGHPEPDFTLSEPLSPCWKSRAIVPTFPSWQSTCHIGDTCGCCKLAIQHSLQTPLWGNPFIAEGGKLKKTFLRLSCSLRSGFDFSFNNDMQPNNTWIWNRVKEREISGSKVPVLLAHCDGDRWQLPAAPGGVASYRSSTHLPYDGSSGGWQLCLEV